MSVLRYIRRPQLTGVKAVDYDSRNLFVGGGLVRRMARCRLVGTLVFILLVLPSAARGGLPRLLVADLHGEADLREIGVATQILVAAALERSGAVGVLPRPQVLAAFASVGVPAREGLWLGPTEARAVCEATRCTQML